MRRALFSVIVVTALLLAGLVWGPRVASATAPCTEGDLRGTYAFSVAVVSGLPGPPEYDAFAGFFNFDGAGHVTGSGAGMENGSVPGGPSGISGTYEVFSDCSGALHLIVGVTPSEAVFFASNRLERLHFLGLDTGTAGAGVADKQ